MSGSRPLSLGIVALLVLIPFARSSAQTSSSTKSKPGVTPGSGIEGGTVLNGVYRNKSLALVCKIPEGWVLRTAEMNAGKDESEEGTEKKPSPQGTQGNTEKSRVLLAAFSRPPEARGADVNASIVIAAESVALYPGMTEAAQYFGPLTEVAKGQGFTVDEEPYEFAIGNRNVVRGDFHKDVGTRVMRQSTLVFLSHGYAISVTVIGGTEDEVEELVDGVGFSAPGK